MQNTTAACCLSIVSQDSCHIEHLCRHKKLSIFRCTLCLCMGVLNIELPCFIVIYPQYPTIREHIKRLLHIASLESHHPEDLPEPPSYVATVLSRSTFDRTEVSLSQLPVIAFFVFALQSLSPEVLCRSSLLWLVHPEQQKESI